VTNLDLAITAIEQLTAENKLLSSQKDELQVKLASLERSVNLATKLVNMGSIPGALFTEKVAEFRSKTAEDLGIIEKAAELVGGGSPFQLGTLTEKINANGIENSLIRCLLED
jgi:cell division septum initiation protein DivIVA